MSKLNNNLRMKHIVKSSKQLKEDVIYISNYDELTKLPTRIHFAKEIQLLCEAAKEKETSFAIMLLNINRLKYINSYLGHVLGDQLIVQITDLFKSFLDNKTFIYRYSEDQFAIIILDLTTKEKCDNMAKKAIGLSSNAFHIGKFELNITINIGICIYPDNAQDCDSITKYVTFALLRAKELGKNKYSFYSSDLDIKYYKQFVLRNDLCKSIERDQLKVYYQPQINLQTNEIIGAEALVRWEHPIWGLVPPNEFISIAEETGFVINIGKWMLTEVCKNYKKWLNGGLQAIKVSINYSSNQFLENNFVENIISIIDEYELSPNFLIIEIIESVLIDNYVQIISSIKELQALGVQVAIDDFGTGFSSLEYLNKFNIDIIKIDKSFIQNATIDKTSYVITSTVINLAKELGIQLIAEGIETWEQLSYLKDLNCNIGQGYLYNRPVPLQEFVILLAKKNCIPVISNTTDDRRNYCRIKFPELIKTNMTILNNNVKKNKVGNTKVLIKDMSLGGLCFLTNLKIPVKSDILLQFNIQIRDEEIKVYGYPVWKEKTQGSLYKYGIEFPSNENMQKNLTGVLVHYIIN